MAGARDKPHHFLEQDEYDAWNGMLTVTTSVLHTLDEELTRTVGLTVREFDVLITLYNAPDRRLGMSALATTALLSPSGLTHLVTRMERDALVVREGDPQDRRKFYAALTDQGVDRLAEARVTHNAVLRETLLPVLGASERTMLAQIGRRFAESGAPPAV